MTEIQPFAPQAGKATLSALLTLERLEAGRHRNRYGETNPNGRSYGGQVLGSAMMAAATGVPDDREPTMLQFVFLQGADPTQPMDFTVGVLQDGKRFSSRYVEGTQAGRGILSANATFGIPLPGPAHEVATSAIESSPWDLESPGGIPSISVEDMFALGGYSFAPHEFIDFRVARYAPRTSDKPARLRFWIKSREVLPDTPAMQAAAFAYLSDWWINFICLADHVPSLAASRQRLYLASLNHTIWFHRPLQADQWLHFECESPSAAAGRGWALARVHDASGRMVASVAQECLMTCGSSSPSPPSPGG